MKQVRLWVCVGMLPALVSAQSSREEIHQHFQRASAAMQQHRLDEAANEFREIIQIDGAAAEAHANLGTVFYMQHRYAEATDEFREALRLKPSLSKAANLLGITLARAGHSQEAFPMLQKSFDASGDRQFLEETGLLLLQVCEALDKPDQSLEVLRVLEREFPSSPEVLYTSYRAHSALAAKAVAQLVRVAPDSALIHQVAGELLDSEGDFPHAVEQYSAALEKNSDLAGGHRARGLALMNASQDDASLLSAQKEFELELKGSPGDAPSEYQLGEIFWRRRQPGDALKHYRRATELRPEFSDALIAVGKIWSFQGEPARALPVLQEAVRIDPDNEVAHFRLAQTYRKLGQQALADQEFARFRKLREASASVSAIYQQVQRKPVTGQTIESPN